VDTILPSGQYQTTQEILKQKLEIATDKSQQDAESGAEHSNSISSLQQDMRHKEKAGG
jgi:ribosomal protein S16